MEKLVSSLINVLQNEYEYHRDLCATARAKKEAIIDNEIDDLTEIVENEKNLLTELDELEEKRNNILSQLAHKLDLKENTLQYNLLQSEVPPDCREDLKQIRSKLLTVIEELHKINEQNKVLLEEAIELNNFSFEVLADVLEDDNNIYKKDQTNNENKNIQHIINHKA